MSLNLRQKEAVEAVTGPVLVIAGAGTGKTTVLVEHVKHLIQHSHISPSQIIATTFTIKATEEMKQRLSAKGCHVPEWIGTFHSICIKIVRANAARLGISANFGVIESDEQKNICKRLFGIQAEAALEQINYWKNNCKKIQDVPQTHEHALHYMRYQQALTEENKFDFGDLIMECCYLWAQHPDILAYYQQQFTHVCIDEFQDTNAVQFLWLQLLASNNPNIHIFCVGDDDQAIYGFRGSDNKYILNFQNTFKNAKIIKLEENYRSTENILKAALKIVGQNKNRLGKTLISKKGKGADVQIMHFPNSYRESIWLCEQIMLQKGEVGVLVRTIWQAQELNKLLREKGMQTSSNLNALLLYLKFLHQPNAELFAQLMQYPKRGLGAAFEAKFLKIYALEQQNLFNMENDASLGQDNWREQNLFNMEERMQVNKPVCVDARSQVSITIRELKNTALQIANIKQKDAIEMLCEQLERWSELTTNTFKLIDAIWRELFQETSLTHALFIAQRYPLLSDFLEHFHLPKISILTIHAAKGLEFDVAYLVGWEENVFPHIRAIITQDIETERRLAYVAITRGKQNVYITHCTARESPKGVLRKGPSRFLELLE